MTVQDDIILFLKITGPTIPSKVAKHIKTEILFASAHLSDLASQKKVKISTLKIGGTPLYYLPGQEDQLFHFAAGNLNPKDYLVVERLKNEQVLRESELDLLTKVSLRSLKDFAVPLNVTTPTHTELFWRWHLLAPEKTNHLISNILNPKPTSSPVTSEVNPASAELNPQLSVEYAFEQSSVDKAAERGIAENNIKVPSMEIMKVQAGSLPQGAGRGANVVSPAPTPPEDVPQRVVRSQTTLKSINESAEGTGRHFPVKRGEHLTEGAVQATAIPETIDKPQRMRGGPGRRKKESLNEDAARSGSLPSERPLPETTGQQEDLLSIRANAGRPDNTATTLSKTDMPNIPKTDTPFGKQLREFLNGLDIDLVEYEQVRKTEINCIIEVPSTLGSVKYAAKAKQKVKIDEKDLAAAYMEAQIKRLPLLYIYTGDLTKKAQEMITRGAYENLTAKKMEPRDKPGSS